MRFRFFPLALLCIAASLGISACGDDTPPMEPPPPTPGEAQWRWLAPVTQGAPLADIWGSSADNLFVVGYDGVVLRYDGSSWRKTNAPTSENLNAVWGTSANHVVAAGDNGTILVFDGTSWKAQSSGTDAFLLDVWGTSSSDIFAVGSNRTVLHYDGNSWSTLSELVPGPALNGVWGTSGTDVYATGIGKNLFHYDGVSWDVLPTPATFSLSAIWGAGPSDIFAVGSNGAAIRFNGVDWEVIDVATDLFFRDLWGRSASEVYASGQNGIIYLWDGDSWSQTANPSVEEVAGVFGGDGRTFAAGQEGALLELSGNQWEYTPQGLTVALEDVWVAPDGAAYFAGERGTILRWRDGVWESMPTGTTQRLKGIHGAGNDDIIAVGRSGTLLRYDGNAWTGTSLSPADLLDVWMLSATDAFVVGSNGVVFRLEDATWNDYTPNGVVDSLNAVWGPDPDHVYVVGAESRALTWNGTQWKLLAIDAFRNNNYHSIHGTSPTDFYVGAEYLGLPSAASSAPALHAGGLVYHWDGAAWTIPYQDPIHDVLGVWRAESDDVFACGDAATILVGSSAGLTRLTELSNLPFYVRSVWGSSPTNVFVVGDNGAVARYSR